MTMMIRMGSRRRIVMVTSARVAITATFMVIVMIADDSHGH